MIPMRSRLGRATPTARLVVVTLVAAIAATVGLRPGAVGTALAAGPLRIAADATYELDPGSRRVLVAIDFDLTNLKPSTGTTFFYYTSVFFAVQPEASNIRVADAAGPLSITTRERRFFTRVDIDLRSNLLYGQTTRFTLRYEMVGGAPRSDSPVRVNRAFATFGVWAWGDAGRSRVEVNVPDGYEVEIDGSLMRLDDAGRGQTFVAEPEKPRTFYAIVSADDLTAYEANRVSVEGGIELVVLSWPDDDRWSQTVTGTLREGMPELVELIGLDWPVAKDLQVRERFTPALEGYAGVFLSEAEGIEVSEDLDSLTILHEASHAWFNPELFEDRWVFEGLAEEYSWRTQTNLGVEPPYGPEEPAADDPGRVPLEDWSFPVVIRDEETDDRERYGYGASFWVVHAIVEAAGLDQMRAAFDAAEARVIAYVGAPAPESATGPSDWRRLIDLAQPIDRPDSPEVEAAIRALVLRGGNRSSLDERHAARGEYRELVAAGKGWLPPILVRRPMSDWRFDDAGEAMDQANAVLARRDEVTAAADALGLIPNDALETAFETASSSFDTANGIATDQLEALTAISGARAAIDAPLDLVAQIGLLGATGPGPTYNEAEAAFERGDLAAAISSSAAVAAVLAGASAAGGERLLMAAAAGIGLLVLVAFVLIVRRRRRRLGMTGPTAIDVAPGASPAPAVASGDAFPATPGEAGPSPAWPLADLMRPRPATPPEPAWWLPTRSSPDPGSTDPATLAADPADPSPPPAASPPDLEGDAAQRESPPDD
jgi:hypothetical protein